MGWGRGGEASALPSVHSGVMVSLLRLVSEVGRISCGGSQVKCRMSSVELAARSPPWASAPCPQEEGWADSGAGSRGWGRGREAGREGL